MTDNGTATLSDRLQGLRDVVWLAIQRCPGRAIRDDRGYVTRLILEKCRIPDTEANRVSLATVLRSLVDDGIISRDYDEGQKRTYAVKVEKPLLESQIPPIVRIRDRVRQQFTAPAPAETPVIDMSELETLAAECRLVHAKMLELTAADRAASSTGIVRASFTQAGRQTSVSSDRFEMLRHYLKRLGLAIAVTKDPTSTTHWLWRITEGTVDIDALRKIIATDPFITYEERLRIRQERGGGRRRGPGVGDNRNGPVTTTYAAGRGPSENGTAATASTSPAAVSAPVDLAVSAPAAEQGIVAALMGVIARLQAENAGYRARLGIEPDPNDVRAVIAQYLGGKG